MAEAEIVNFRAPRPLVEKLDRLARDTCRNRSAVLRLLIEQAEARPDPDVVLREPLRQHVASG